MNQKVIILDGDGCMWDSQDQMRLALLRETGVNLPLVDWRRSHHIFDVAKKLMPTRSEADIFQILFGDAVIAAAPPLIGSVEFVNKVVAANWLTVLVTGRPEDQLDLTLSLLERDSIAISPEHVHCCPKGMSGAVHKAFWYHKYHASAAVEDMAEAATTISFGIARSSPKVVGLIDKSWNWWFDVPADSKIVRIGSWLDGDPGWAQMFSIITSLET